MGACQRASDTHHAEEPVILHESDDGTIEVELKPKAMERIDLQVATVVEREMSAPVLVVPYSALLYDAHGDTWVYVETKERFFKRHAVTVERIEGDEVFLSAGPEVGASVATVGVVEIYGSEFKVGH